MFPFKMIPLHYQGIYGAYSLLFDGIIDDKSSAASLHDVLYENNNENQLSGTLTLEGLGCFPKSTQ